MQRLALCWTSVVITLFTFRIDLAHAASGNTTCASTQLDWYTDAVGETPCVTYQRLRQICNSDYQVPTFRPNTPGDNCDDQLMLLQFNFVGLSMLCMNCQYDPATGTTGIDAGVGAYEMYSTRGDGSMCTPGTNKTLPADIQSAVCNRGIKISDFLYDLFWSDGTWFYIYTKETAQTDQAANNNNTFSHCPNTTSTISATSSTQTSSASPSPSVTASSPSTISPPPQFSSNLGAIVGGAVGGGLGLIAVFCSEHFCYIGDGAA
ncbi:hypothetical protein A0H81_08586 [Grifola frondosa]|uniref:Uncharacterized protein n=1 Tax=Grifola frondosa TaxID=5627 RepID=A0A1C7M457_GRIFR|nr:hypothetical protein A0H81_08586 [Grifola frondosa]